MTVAVLTRDGAVSTAAVCEAHTTRPLETVRATLPEIGAWASENGVKVPGNGDLVATVNAFRDELVLPPFEVAAPVQVQQQPRATPKPCTLPPIAETEAEMMALVNGFVGTKTGTLTPAMAAVLLTLNLGNRVLTKSQVHRYCTIIREDRWLLTGEPIIVASNGLLNEGAHRLTAIVEAQIPVEIDVRFGADREAFIATNTGAGRTAGQALHILGQRNTSRKASIARMLFLYDNNRLTAGGGSTKVETAQIIEVIQANPNIDRAAAFVRGVGSGFVVTRTTSFGFVLVIAARVSTFEKALEFGRAVKDGRGSDNDPTRVLHLRLRDLKRRTLPFELAAPAVRAWNAWIAGKELSRLVMLDSDNSSAGFPRICGPKGER